MVNYYWFIIFAFLTYLIVTDNSVSQFIVILSNILKLNYEKLKWWLIYNPSNPIVRYFMWKKAYKLAEELQKEFESKSK